MDTIMDAVLPAISFSYWSLRKKWECLSTQFDHLSFQFATLLWKKWECLSISLIIQAFGLLHYGKSKITKNACPNTFIKSLLNFQFCTSFGTV